MKRKLCPNLVLCSSGHIGRSMFTKLLRKIPKHTCTSLRHCRCSHGTSSGLVIRKVSYLVKDHGRTPATLAATYGSLYSPTRKLPRLRGTPRFAILESSRQESKTIHHRRQLTPKLRLVSWGATPTTRRIRSWELFRARKSLVH